MRVKKNSKNKINKNPVLHDSSTKVKHNLTDDLDYLGFEGSSTRVKSHVTSAQFKLPLYQKSREEYLM